MLYINYSDNTRMFLLKTVKEDICIHYVNHTIFMTDNTII